MIVLVCVIGITLINSLNLSNIIRLNEQVAIDSINANENELREMSYMNKHPKYVHRPDSSPYHHSKQNTQTAKQTTTMPSNEMDRPQATNYSSDEASEEPKTLPMLANPMLSLDAIEGGKVEGWEGKTSVPVHLPLIKKEAPVMIPPIVFKDSNRSMVDVEKRDHVKKVRYSEARLGCCRLMLNKSQANFIKKMK